MKDSSINVHTNNEKNRRFLHSTLATRRRFLKMSVAANPWEQHRFASASLLVFFSFFFGVFSFVFQVTLCLPTYLWPFGKCIDPSRHQSPPTLHPPRRGVWIAGKLSVRRTNISPFPGETQYNSYLKFACESGFLQPLKWKSITDTQDNDHQIKMRLEKSPHFRLTEEPIFYGFTGVLNPRGMISLWITSQRLGRTPTTLLTLSSGFIAPVNH